MKFAYARVSTQDQSTDRQTDLLTDCDEVFIEKITGIKASRPELDKMIGKLRTGDVVKVECSVNFDQYTFLRKSDCNN